MSDGNGRVSDWLLERLARGDLPSHEAARVRARLAAEPDGAARLEALRQSDQEILATLPPATVAAEVKRRLKAQNLQAAARVRRPFMMPALALGAAAAMALVIAVRPSARPEVVGDDIEITREKGLRPQIIVYRKKSDSRADRLSGDTTVRPRDVLQVAYVAGGRRYGIIVSVDARGTVTPHLPETSGPAVALSAQGETALPHAYELDDSPGFERFVLVTSDVAFATADVVDALRPGGAPLPKDLIVTELTLRKETP